MGSSFPKELSSGWFVEQKKVIDETESNVSHNYKYELKFKEDEFDFVINKDKRVMREGGGSIKDEILIILYGNATVEEDNEKNYKITFNVKRAQSSKGGFMNIPEEDPDQVKSFEGHFDKNTDVITFKSNPKTVLDQLTGVLKRV